MSRLCTLSPRRVALPIVAILAIGGAAHGQCSPSVLASVDTPDIAFGIAVSGSIAYLADEASGLQIIDVSDPANAMVVGVMDTPGLAFGVAVSGSVAYVADGACGLLLVDVSDPQKPSILGTADTPDFAQDVAVAGKYAYVADQFSGMHVVDVLDPANPTIVGSADTPDRAMSVAVSGNLVFVADQLSGVQIIDVSDPANPVIRSEVGSADRALGITAVGTLAYAAVRAAGLQVIDASDPVNPVVLDTITTPRALGVAVAGTKAYLADAISGLHVIDVSDPANLSIQGVAVTPGGDANRVAVWGTVSYVANFTGLRVLDVSLCFDFGACCLEGNCLDLQTELNCLSFGGTFLGDNSICTDASCFNDGCDAAITIADGDTTFSTIGATTDGPALPPECDENPADFQNDIWYRYTPPATGTLTVSTCDQADFDTRVGVYSGACGELDLVSCRDEGAGVCSLATSLLEAPVTRGEPVLVRVGGNGPHSGTGTLTLTLAECESDVDGDRVVNIVDLLRIITDWGPCP